MRFKQIRLQNFRNIEFAELGLEADRIFLLGANGQGKSNLLEALGLVTALRSFRTQNLGALARRGSRDFTLVYGIEHDRQGATELEIRSSAGARKVFIDGEPVTRLGDFLGRFPVVPLSSGDLMLLRGGPGDRRRFLDLTLSAVDSAYYRALCDYHRGVAERNRLLKRGGSGPEFSAFEAEIARCAVEVAAQRTAGVERLREVLQSVYAGIAEADEGPELELKMNAPATDREFMQRLLRDQRPRDQILGATQRGPHRDDLALSLKVGGAREYASDGQQRGLCVALRIAQARFFEANLSLQPVLLADDVLGELDPHRRAGFWRSCPAAYQILATGTELPAVEVDADWQLWQVAAGKFTKSPEIEENGKDYG